MAAGDKGVGQGKGEFTKKGVQRAQDAAIKGLQAGELEDAERDRLLAEALAEQGERLSAIEDFLAGGDAGTETDPTTEV